MSANLMEAGTAWMLGELKDHASEAVDYERDGDKLVGVKAVVAETMARTLSADAIEIQLRGADFLILVADLVLPVAGAIKPAVGDTVTRTVEGETIVFEVLPVLDEKEYRESDRFGLSFRIHTKELSRT